MPALPAKKSQKVSVFVVDDHHVVREGLVAILDRESDIRVIGQAETAEQALDRLTDADPDVVVVDYRLPGMDGVGLCREIAERRMRARVVVLSGFLDDDAVHASMMAGARAYIVKDVEAAELKRAIRAAACGETMIDPKVTGRIVGWAARSDSPTLLGELRPSELQVLRLLCQGKSPKEISAATKLRPQTVKSYLREIYTKLGVGSRAEAIAIALRRGIA
jgi:DNA-binding NarL/FixJ family response regulator